MIRTTCPQCGREDAIADYLASLPVLCKQCGQRVTMGEVIAPTKAPTAPPPPPPPPAPPKVVVPPPPPASRPAPLPKPEPAAPVVAEAEPVEPPVHTNGAVITPRPAFANATGPGVVDLFEGVNIPEQRSARPPLPPVPPPLPAPMPAAPVGVSFHRGRRLAARLVTLTGAVVALAAGILLVGFAPGVVKNDKLMSTIFLFVPIGLYALYNVVLLGTKGQDFGKRVLKLRIVGDDGTPARFGRAFLKRELVVILLLAGLIPLAWKLYKHQQAGELAGMWQRSGWQMFMPNRMAEVMPAVAAVLFSLLNALMIFNKDGKCIHDRLAKTTVTRG